LASKRLVRPSGAGSAGARIEAVRVGLDRAGNASINTRIARRVGHDDVASGAALGDVGQSKPREVDGGPRGRGH
jgi:hypothetical protein